MAKTICRGRRAFSTILTSLDLPQKLPFVHKEIAKHDASYYPYTEEVLDSKLAPLLQSCSAPHPHLSIPFIHKAGQQIHAQIAVNGLTEFGILGTRILGLYILCHKLFDAQKVFCRLKLCYALPWNWMIRGFNMMGWFDYAVLFYFKMLLFGTSPDKYTFPYVIKACAGLCNVRLGSWVHGAIRDLGFEKDVFVGSALVKFYAENGCLQDARRVFDEMPERDGVLWNVMLNGYAKSGKFVHNVIDLFKEMRLSETRPNSVTYASVISVCGLEKWVSFGTQVHGNVITCGFEMDPLVLNTMIAMYGKCQRLFEAQKLFDLVEDADLVTWNAIISGYAQNGFMSEPLVMFREMISNCVVPDSTTFASLIPLFSESEALYKGKEIHCYIVRHNVILDLFLKNSLIDMYLKCRSVEMACTVFSQTPGLDVVICTSMISGFILNGKHAPAIEMFRLVLNKKLRPNAVTLASILPACASLAALQLGKELHGRILKSGLEGVCYVSSALTDMYAKCGRLDLAQLVFSRLSERDTVCWNTMLTIYSQNAKPERAIDLFSQMAIREVAFDCVTLSAILSACANLPSLSYGKEIHSFMIRSSFNTDIFAESALIDMYGKCGRLDLARRVFDKMEHKNEVSWNSMIAAYGNHGCVHDSVSLFGQMREQGFGPDHVTFLAILSACGHAGQIEEAKQYFYRMPQEFNITAMMEHYACMIDLLGRAGHLQEAFQVIGTMPYTPDAGIWGTLLGACRMHGNVELAELASSHLMHLEPQNSGYYMLLSNVQAHAGKWEGVHKIRNMMKERGVEKVPGYSWVEVNNTTHVFGAGDTSHPQSTQVYVILNHLLMELEKVDYFPESYQLLFPENYG